MTIKAARLDEQGVYQGIDELADASALTPLHLPQIEACDLAPGLYRWVPDVAAEKGGAFWPIAYLEFLARAQAEADAERGRPKFQPGKGQSRREFAAEQRAQEDEEG